MFKVIETFERFGECMDNSTPIFRKIGEGIYDFEPENIKVIEIASLIENKLLYV